MKTIELSTIGEDAEKGDVTTWHDLNVGKPWTSVVEVLAPGSIPTDAQVKAIRDGGLLSSRRNLLISGPTNSGKSLLAYLALLRGVLNGGRVLLLEPLKAIAQEKLDELKIITSTLEGVLGKKVDVTITTGDYRLNEESMQSPPPELGEVVIATPERIEAILRNPDFDSWISSFQVVCVDEAHLVSDGHRGATLEYVIASFLSLSAPPRLVLLSATLGDMTPLVKWLNPCDAVLSQIRRPPLKRSIVCLDKDEDMKASLTDMVKQILEDSAHSVLIFVYQTSWAGALARELQEGLGSLCGAEGAGCYHSRLSADTKARVRQQFMAGTTRCVVSTASLAMGVNLPATHVIVRDLSYGPGQPLSIGSLVQMMGRAGRGYRPGHAALFFKYGELGSLESVQNQLERQELPALHSVLVQSSQKTAQDEPPLAETILSLLARKPEDGFSLKGVEQFMLHTLCGEEAAYGCAAALKWLSNASRLLAFEHDGIWRATRLGQSSIRSSLPLGSATGVAQLIRDLLSVDPDDNMLSHMSALDVLLLVELLSSKPMLRKQFSEELARQVDDWASREDTKSILFHNWIRGANGFSKAPELLGSLGLEQGTRSGAKKDQARKQAYMAMFRTIVLWQRAHGVINSDLERRWQVKDLDEIQEQWRDDRLFHLGAMRGLWDLRCFFYHLKEDNQANDERVLRVKRAFQRLNVLSLQLMNLVSWCSPLGSLFVRLRSSLGKGSHGSPAQGTMRRLEDAGISSIESLRSCTLEQMQTLGVRRDIAVQINTFLRRR
jgi:superfamily II DNA/RNA helicase